MSIQSLCFKSAERELINFRASMFPACRYWVALLRESICKRLPVPDNKCFLLANSALLPAAYATDGIMSLQSSESQRLTDSPRLQQ